MTARDTTKDIALYMGQQIKIHRKRKGMKQQDLADILGISRTSVSNLETGVHLATLRTFIQLCIGLEIYPSQLFPTDLKSYTHPSVEEKRQQKIDRRRQYLLEQLAKLEK